ncbi:hypothetical protein VTL71DRAFT_13454 [Oculimacula yallundae]|uniref:Uncharacterized protein n=1 Tax=Oculimacula yallundae TaxID=86028 RepID=A0ABR4CKE2_9HELO
MPIILKIESDS